MQGRGTTGLKVGDRVIAMGKPDVNRKAFITDSIGLYRWTPENKALVVKAAKATRLSGVQENAGSANTGWKTYRDKDIGFTMPYLEAWIVEQSPAKRDSPDRTVSFIVPVPSGKQAFILVERHWLGGTSFESAIGQLHGDPKIRIEKAVLGDESAYKVTESRKGLRSVAYYIDGGKTMWSINFFAREEDEWDEFESRFESVRQGFRLTTKSEPTE